MSTWNIYLFSEGDFPGSPDATIPRPNQSLDVPLTVNQQRFTLADGDTAFVTSEVRTQKQTLNMSWVQQTKTFVDQLKAYMNNHDYIKIETHIASYDFIGRFISINPVWKVGEDEKWDISVIFEVME